MLGHGLSGIYHLLPFLNICADSVLLQHHRATVSLILLKYLPYVPLRMNWMCIKHGMRQTVTFTWWSGTSCVLLMFCARVSVCLMCSCRSSNKTELCFKNILTGVRLTVLDWLIINSYKITGSSGWHVYCLWLCIPVMSVYVSWSLQHSLYIGCGQFTL